jgi:hypothetical protein
LHPDKKSLLCPALPCFTASRCTKGIFLYCVMPGKMPA